MSGSESKPGGGSNLDQILTEVEEDAEKVSETGRSDYDPRALNYPEYFDVDREFEHDEELSEEEVYKALLAQAIAQEKVGFEKETEKFFMEDFDPSSYAMDKPGKGGTEMTREERSRLFQTSVAGRMVIGAGGVLAGAGTAVALTVPEYSAMGWIAAAAGALMVVFGP